MACVFDFTVGGAELTGALTVRVPFAFIGSVWLASQAFLSVQDKKEQTGTTALPSIKDTQGGNAPLNRLPDAVDDRYGHYTYGTSNRSKTT